MRIGKNNKINIFRVLVNTINQHNYILIIIKQMNLSIYVMLS